MSLKVTSFKNLDPEIQRFLLIEYTNLMTQAQMSENPIDSQNEILRSKLLNRARNIY